MLKWARETAGLDLVEAVGHLGFIKANKREGAVQRLMSIERGERKPTRNQLLKFASVYRRPLLTFYLEKPPAKADYGEDFRQAKSQITRRENALLDALLRDIRLRQEMARSLLEDEDVDELPFVGSARNEERADVVAQSIATILKFDHQNFEFRPANPDALFKTLRERAEAAGVFVLLVGNLGSYHTALDADVFRGFAISDRIAPFVVINDQDARAARSFTLLHELAHIWLDKSGVSGAPSPETPKSVQDRIERFCNDVAGEFLLPAPALHMQEGRWNAGDRELVAEFIRSLSGEWAVSKFMVAYRLNRIGLMETELYKEFVAEHVVRWQRHRLRQKEKNREKKSGPDYNVVTRSKLGNALLDVARRNLRGNALTHTKAAKLLGVKAGAVERLIRGYEKDRRTMLQKAR